MKKKIMLIMAWLCLVYAAHAQNPCTTSGCTASTLNISTGYDHVTSTYKTPLALESNWELVAVPTNASITLPAPSYVIVPNSAWSNFPNAKWVGPFQNSAYSINNPPNGPYGAFEFRNCFCICQQTTVHIKFDLMADDKAYAFIDGIPIGTFAGSGNQFNYANRLVVDTNITLSAGTHCLSVKLYNIYGVAIGFSVEGNVTGANLLSATCCNATGRICGTKLLDINCDGSVDPATDAGLAGWTITLKNSAGVTVGTAVTDAQGNYCFDDLAPGTYTVSETNQPGWTQSYPTGSGIHTVNVVAGGMVQANFGNCGTGSICGLKYNDVDCDHVIDPSVDPGLPGWTIQAWLSSAGVTLSAVTDGSGKYCIENLPPGNYYVYEINQPGWTQTFPTTSTYNITLPTGGSAQADFGNCQQPTSPCDAEVAFEWKNINCGIKFAPVIGAIPAGYQLATTEWTFGDGYSSLEYAPAHFYQNPGTYTVCLKVTFFNGDKCCVREFCKDVKAEACEGGCKIEPEIGIEYSEKDCSIKFTGNILSTSTPITSWFWDFDDGTTGNGSMINHTFPCKGVYKVCLVVFGVAGEGEECCFKRICTEVKVDCDPCEKKTAAARTSETGDGNDMKVELKHEQAIVLNQNVPNPFAESTLITYNIPARYTKAQLLFNTSNGKLVKTVDIKSAGKGAVTVYANDLSSGVYTYTLVVDGKIIDSKKMVKQ